MDKNLQKKKLLNVCLNENINFEKLEDEYLFNRVSDKLIDGGVVGWFQGRAEFGPRALGHRSILVDPRRKDKRPFKQEDKKKRSFRPFAPSILEEYVEEYFVQNDEVPFMDKVFDIKKGKTI